MTKEIVDHEYRKATIGDGFGILNVACAAAGTRYAITIPERHKGFRIQSTDGSAFKVYKTQTSTPAISVPANGSIEIKSAAPSKAVCWVAFAAATKVAEVLYIV